MNSENFIKQETKKIEDHFMKMYREMTSISPLHREVVDFILLQSFDPNSNLDGEIELLVAQIYDIEDNEKYDYAYDNIGNFTVLNLIHYLFNTCFSSEENKKFKVLYNQKYYKNRNKFGNCLFVTYSDSNMVESKIYRNKNVLNLTLKEFLYYCKKFVEFENRNK